MALFGLGKKKEVQQSACCCGDEACGITGIKDTRESDAEKPGLENAYWEMDAEDVIKMGAECCAPYLK